MSNIQPIGFGIVCVRTKSIYHSLTRTLTKDKHDLIGFYYMAAAKPRVMSSGYDNTPKYSVLLYDVNSGCVTTMETLSWNTLLDDEQVETITYIQLVCPDVRVKKEFELQFQTFVTSLITERVNINQIKHKELIEKGIHQRILSVLQENINLRTGYVIVNSMLSILSTICLGSHVHHTSVPDDMLLDSSLLQSPITFSVNGSKKTYCDFGIHLAIFCNIVRHLLTTRDDVLHYVISGIDQFSSNRKLEDQLLDATTVSLVKPELETIETKDSSELMGNVERLIFIESMLLEAMDTNEYNQAIILIEELNNVRKEITDCKPIIVPSILYESSKVVAEISKLRDYMDDTLNQISSGMIPVIRINELVQKVNNLCKIGHIDPIQLDPDEFSASYASLITMESEVEVDPDIKVELKSGDNIILPVSNANVSGIPTPILIEILHYLNGLPYREKRFTPLRISVTAEIAKRRN